MTLVGVYQDGDLEWHLPADAHGCYVTLCHMDGDDPVNGQVPHRGRPKKGQKVTCKFCKQIWVFVTTLPVTAKDFT